MDVELVFNFIAILPAPTTLHLDGGDRELQSALSCLLGMLVKLGGDRQPFSDVQLLGGVLIAEERARSADKTRQGTGLELLA